MKLASTPPPARAEPTAWTHVQLGKLYFNHGRYRRTPSASSASPLRIFPNYAYGLDALAAGAGGARPPTARRSRPSGRRSTAIPLPQYVGALGDLYRVTGQPRARAAAVRADRRDREAAARERRPHRPRDRALPGRPRDRAAARARPRAGRPRRAARRSTATTCSAGRSPGTAIAPRRSPTRSARSASARRTRSSSSTAG